MLREDEMDAERSAHGGLVQALVLDGIGGARSVQLAEIDSLSLQSGEVLWLHWDRSHPQAQLWLRERSGLSPFACDLMLEEDTRPRQVQLDDQQILLFLRGVNLNPGADPEDMVSLRLFVEKQRVISLRQRQLRARAEVSAELRAGQGATTAHDLVLRLAELLTEKVNPLLSGLAEVLDSEEELLDADERYAPNHDKMLQARRQAASLRRFLAPQKEIFFQLASQALNSFVGDQARHWGELGNNLTRQLEELELIRERVGLVLESEHRRMSARMNRLMYLFAIITCFFLPLSFITGLLGINVGGIPGAGDTNGFYAVCFLMLLIAFGQWWAFRRLRWL